MGKCTGPGTAGLYCLLLLLLLLVLGRGKARHL